MSNARSLPRMGRSERDSRRSVVQPARTAPAGVIQVYDALRASQRRSVLQCLQVIVTMPRGPYLVSWPHTTSWSFNTDPSWARQVWQDTRVGLGTSLLPLGASHPPSGRGQSGTPLRAECLS